MNLVAELMAICRQVKTAQADAIMEFKASQPFIDAYAVYYGDEFEDCLKQFRFVYPNLDLSKVTMDNPLLTTLAHSDTVSEDPKDSTESKQDPKDDGVVLAQPTVKGPIVPLASFADDPSAHDALKSAAQDTSDSFAQDTQDPSAQDALNAQLQSLVFILFYFIFLCNHSYFQTTRNALVFGLCL